jgi:LEA14-like dessication related protein
MKFEFKKIFLLVNSVILILGLGACSGLPTNLIQPKVNLQQVNVADPTFSDATMIFQFVVENPNAVDLKVDQVNYDLALNGKPFTKGILEKGLQVGANSSAVIPVPIRVRYSDLASSIGDFLRNGSTPYEVQGSVKMGFFSIPFKKLGEVQLRQ